MKRLTMGLWVMRSVMLMEDDHLDKIGTIIFSCFSYRLGMEPRNNQLGVPTSWIGVEGNNPFFCAGHFCEVRVNQMGY